MDIGRPTKYKEEYNDLVYKFCLLGAIDEQIADFFDVCVDTINEWKKVYPDFSASIKRGKQLADAEVASSLFQRAKGYQHPDVDLKMFDGQIIKTEIVKCYPPDTTAGIFWLKNRQPKEWREKQDIDINAKSIQINFED